MKRHAREVESPRQDRGETLIELLVTIVVMGLAVVTILGSIATSVEQSATNRQQVTAQYELRSYAEAIESYIDEPQSGYVPCAKQDDYAKPPTFDPGSYDASVTNIQYWTGDPNPWTNNCQTDADPGIQKLTLQVDLPSDPRVSETLVIIVRQPCRPEDETSGSVLCS